MCWTCDHPEASPQDYLDHLADLMRDRGWMVQAVGGTRLYAPFAYTVGLTAVGLPELLVTGLKARPACELLNHVAAYTVQKSVILPGETMGADPWLLEAVHVEVPDAHLLTAVELYGPAVRALQLAWADDRGRWPWEVGHRAGRGGQPLFGVRTPWRCDQHKLPVPQQ